MPSTGFLWGDINIWEGNEINTDLFADNFLFLDLRWIFTAHVFHHVVLNLIFPKVCWFSCYRMKPMDALGNSLLFALKQDGLYNSNG